MTNLPLEDAVNSINRDIDESLVSTVKRLEAKRSERIAAAQKVHALLPLLTEAVGEERVEVPQWEYFGTIYVNLGQQPAKRERAKRTAFNGRLVALRKILGNLEEHDKSVHSAENKTVQIVYRSQEHPEVRVRMVCKLTKKDKCRLVKVRQKAYTRTELVCTREDTVHEEGA